MDVDPKNLFIVTYPAQVLRTKAAPIDRVDDLVRAVAARMFELMDDAEGIGLAAPQVGLPWRMFVAHVRAIPSVDDLAGDAGPGTSPASTSNYPDHDQRRVYINPVLTLQPGSPEPGEEGCLSLPDIRGSVLRSPRATIAATDELGRPFRMSASGLLARCWQHEMDHLDGVLILDRMTQMGRLRNRAAVRDLERRA